MFAKVLMQYGMLKILTLESEANKWLCASATGLTTKFAVVYEEYTANVAFWQSVIDWKGYVDAIVSIRFLHKTSPPLALFKSEFTSRLGLIEPEELLWQIDTRIFGLESTSDSE